MAIFGSELGVELCYSIVVVGGQLGYSIVVVGSESVDLCGVGLVTSGTVISVLTGELGHFCSVLSAQLVDLLDIRVLAFCMKLIETVDC